MSGLTHEEWISEIVGAAADDVSAMRVALETMQQAIVRIADKLDEPPMSAWPRVASYEQESKIAAANKRALQSVHITPASTYDPTLETGGDLEKIERRNSYGEVITRVARMAGHEILQVPEWQYKIFAAVLAEMERQDAEGLPTEKMFMPRDERGCVFTAATCMREALRLSLEGL